MKLTTRSRYGLLAMVYIAKNATKDHPVPLSEIAASLQLSDAYLEQLLRILKKGGLIQSTRGVKGGYLLAAPASEITAISMLNALEGELWLSDCARAGDCPAGFSNCPSRFVITRMNDAIYHSVKNITLQDMVEISLAV